MLMAEKFLQLKTNSCWKVNNGRENSKPCVGSKSLGYAFKPATSSL